MGKTFTYTKKTFCISMVFAWMPAIAIYFDDPDGNSLEFISMLEGQGLPELGVINYVDWLKITETIQKPT